jgi:hypothetical protein
MFADAYKCIYVLDAVSKVTLRTAMVPSVSQPCKLQIMRCAEYWKVVDINEIQKAGLASKSSICSIPFSFSVYVQTPRLVACSK